MRISPGKMEVLVQANPNQTMYPHPTITTDEVPMKCVESIKYLTRTIPADRSLDKEIMSRMQKASLALGRLRQKVLQKKGIRLAYQVQDLQGHSLPFITVMV